MEDNFSIPYEAAAALLRQGLRIRVPLFWGIKLPLVIRPLHPGTIVALSQQTEKLTPVSEGQQMVAEMLKTGKNLRVHCRMVAIAGLNSWWKIRLFSSLVSRVILWGVSDMSELMQYMTLIYRQMDAERFFFIMTMTSGMNFLKKKPDATKEETVSGEPSV